MKPKEFNKLLEDNQFRLEITNHLLNNESNYLISKYNLSTKYVKSLRRYLGIPSRNNTKKHWYTNGISDIIIYDGETIPEGFYPGRTNNIISTKGTKWITNGIVTRLLAPEEPLPEGFRYGSSNRSTKNYVWVNNGIEDKFVLKSNIPVGYTLGRINVEGYKQAGALRKKYTYNNGKDEIKLTLNQHIPDGYVLGKLPKLSIQDKIKLRDAEYLQKGYIPVKALTKPQLVAYAYYRDKTNLITDVISKRDCYTYISLKYIPLLDEYAKVNHSKGTSLEEDLVYEYLKSIYKGEIKRHVKNILKEDSGKYYEIDMYIPEKRLGIEFNGIYWHSDLQKDKNYHFNKSKLAESKGIRLINIYEDEWLDSDKQSKIKTMLNIALGLVKNKIYARKCIIKELTNKEAKPFNDLNHLQGHRNAQVTYGLYYKGELVQLMSFSKTKYNRNLKDNNSWEIIRGCPGGNNLVVGGVSKLLSYFIKQHNPSQVFSYCDFNKFDGRGYEKAGMKFIGYTGPDMWWIINNERVMRSPSKHKEYKNKATCKIYGSGSKKYILELYNYLK